VATPLELVVAVVVVAFVSVKTPSVAVNVTGRPLTAVEVGSNTVTESGVANCVPSVVLCGLPPATEIACGTSVFDIVKIAVDWDVPTEATTR
jgi:hypothetical protein